MSLPPENKKPRTKRNAGDVGMPQVDVVTVPEGGFAAELQSLLSATIKGKRRKKNPELRKSIKDALQISDTTLYFWQNPGKTPAGRENKMKPSADQVARLGLILADEHKLKRDDLVKKLLGLAGYDPSHPAPTSDTADALTGLHNQAKEIVKHVLPQKLPRSSSALSVGCFFSQRLLLELAAEWKEDERGGHIVFFWRWQGADVLKYFEGNALESFRKWIDDLIIPGSEAKTFVTVFLVLQGGDKFDEASQRTMIEALKPLGDRVVSRMTLYVDSRKNLSQQELFDAGILMSPIVTIPFVMVGYPTLYSACSSLTETEQNALQKVFNPIMWTTQVIQLDSSVVADFLNERRIRPLIPGVAVRLIDDDDKRWRKVGLNS